MNDIKKYRCKFHPENQAIMHCNSCKAHICRECIISIGSKKYCKRCYNKHIIKRYEHKLKKRIITCEKCLRNFDINYNYCPHCGDNKLSKTKPQKLNKHNQSKIKNSKDNFEQKNKSTSYEKSNNTYLNKSYFKVSLFLGAITFLISYFLFLNISYTMEHPLRILSCIAGVTLICTLLIFWKIILNSKSNKNSKIQILAGILFFFLLANSLEIYRLRKIQTSYAAGLNFLNRNEIYEANKIFSKLSSNPYKYKRTIEIADSINNKIKYIKSDSLITIANSYLSKGNYIFAIEFANKALRHVKNYQQAYQIYFTVGKYYNDLAKIISDKAIILMPLNAQNWLLIISKRSMINRYSELKFKSI